MKPHTNSHAHIRVHFDDFPAGRPCLTATMIHHSVWVRNAFDHGNVHFQKYRVRAMFERLQSSSVNLGGNENCQSFKTNDKLWYDCSIESLHLHFYYSVDSTLINLECGIVKSSISFYRYCYFKEVNMDDWKKKMIWRNSDTFPST